MAQTDTQKASIREEKRRKAKRAGIIIWGSIVLLIFVSFTWQYLLGAVAYPFVLSEGERIGQVTKLSKKGLIWKTWEGTLGVTQSGAYTENWNFSVDAASPDEAALVSELQSIATEGSIVRITYKQHIGIRPWHGKTSYIIEDIDILNPGNRNIPNNQLNSKNLRNSGD